MVNKELFGLFWKIASRLKKGLGIVHSAPAFGEVDFYACQRAGIDPVCPVDNNGQFTDEIPEYRGLFVKDADKEIIRRLKARGEGLPSRNLPPPLSLLLALRYSFDLQGRPHLVCGC